MSLKNINNSVSLFLLNLLAFCIPLSKALISPLIILFVASSIVHFVVNKYKVNKYNMRSLLLPVLLYLLYIAGTFFSEDRKSAGFDLEVKLSLILLPLCFLVVPLPDLKLAIQLFKKYIFGCFTGIFLCSVAAIHTYYITNNFESFFYTNLSYYHHPSYFAMYLVFAMSLILIHLLHNYNKLNTSKLLVYVTSIFLLGVFIIMLASKAGMLSFGFVIVSFCIYFIIKFKKYFIGSGLIFFLFLISFIAINKSETLKRRITESVTAITDTKPKKDEELQTTSMRKVVWKSSLKLITTNIWGYGTGDVKNVLAAQYKMDGNVTAEHKHLNAHNQFLQTTLAIGWPGLIVLLTLLLYPEFNLEGIQKVVFVFFALSFIIFCLTESMLETQAGVVFFAFFYTFINAVSLKATK